jgi:uncharacterized C2H2 Zn-finger protein
LRQSKIKSPFNKAKKIKKLQCLHCSEIFTKRAIKSHSQNCQIYSKLIKNCLECSVCSKSFESRKALNRHIGHNHKEAFSEIKQKSNLENKNEFSEFCQKPKMDLSNERSAIPGLEISKEQNPGILVTKTLAKPDESRKRKNIQCPHCSEIFDSHSYDRHSNNCHVYEKLVKNDLECGVCFRSFKKRRYLNQHIGHQHKDVLKEFVPFLSGVLIKNINPRNENQIPF